MTITIDEAEDIVDYNPLARQEVSQHRWYTKELIVYKDDDQLMGFYYLNPLTEIQDGQDRFESDPVRVFPVVAEEITTTIYKPKE